MSNPAFEFVRQLGVELAAGEFDLPPFPDTAMRVQRCVADADSDINSLGVIIASEPALAARLMRMANSAMMRRGPMEVTDINTAISRVGMEMVQNAAVSFAAREAFTFPSGGPFLADLNKLRLHSVKVASLSYVLAKNSRFTGNPDEAMLAGLLHAVGKFYILTKAADHTELFTDREAVDKLLAQWHTGVARAIVESWDFPESIAVGVDEQELKERDRIASAGVSDVLFIANVLARAGVKVASELGDLDALARLRMDGDKLAQTLEDHEEEIQSMIDALSG
ncbi:MAG: HD-like signal output (HDOD) protein [Glaciecola sp.]|jgi:HD-like signal output (HDOD) protein|uniref:HDOD domain-containing protein n=1 Tax=Congregibacter sp. TaxID=2744308 RepID=UPI0039E606C7